MDTGVIFHSQQGMLWDWRVAIDLFFGGMGVGTFLFAVLVDWRYGGKYRRICQTGAYLAPLFVIIGLLFLMMKMGRPMAIFYTFTSFAPSSPLWWGGIFQLLFIIGALYYAYLWKQEDEADIPARKKLGWYLMPIALIVGAYHGFLLGVLFRARPLWNTGPTVITAILGFITTGIAATMLVHLIRMKLAGRLEKENEAKVSEFLDEIHEVRLILAMAMVFQLFTFFIWWVALVYGSLDSQAALASANSAYGIVFWLGGIGLGLIVPLGLCGYLILRSSQITVTQEVQMIWLTSALILVGGFIFRLTVVMGGQVGSTIHILS